tara:strand:+ start:167 stop:379 length:213 start_codon:yes stop_codon:yes gene_type:complete
MYNEYMKLNTQTNQGANKMETKQYILKVDYHNSNQTTFFLVDSKLKAEVHAFEFHDIDHITAEVFEAISL